MDITNERKRGKLSLDEEKFIRQNVANMSVEDIAKSINRTVDPVLKYIRKKALTSNEISSIENAHNNLSLQLRSREYWNEIQKHFTETELVYFEDSWVKLMMQFREDVLYAEELELKQYITLEILINRNMSERQRTSNDIERIQKQLDKEYELGSSRDVDLIASLEGQVAFLRTVLPTYAVEYTKLLDKRQESSKTLKATREQRIKRIEDSKTSWASYIKALEDEEYRERVGDEAELMKLAKDKAAERLGELHTYGDGKIDRPLLNAETVEKD